MTAEEVLALLDRRLRDVLALDGPISPEARFDADLHADSLDLVEVIEAVERDLAGRGVVVTLPEEAMRDLVTVDDAARRIADLAAGGRP